MISLLPHLLNGMVNYCNTHIIVSRAMSWSLCMGKAARIHNMCCGPSRLWSCFVSTRFALGTMTIMVNIDDVFARSDERGVEPVCETVCDGYSASV